MAKEKKQKRGRGNPHENSKDRTEVIAICVSEAEKEAFRKHKEQYAKEIGLKLTDSAYGRMFIQEILV